jgi:hypothetical protein
MPDRSVMPIGEKMVRGKVEEERDDDTDGIGEKRGKTETKMESYLNNEGQRHAGDTRRVEAQAARPPGAIVAGEVTEGNAIVGNEISKNRDLGRYQVREYIVELGAYRQWDQQADLEEGELDHGRESANHQEGGETLNQPGSTMGSSLDDGERSINQCPASDVITGLVYRS